MTQTRCKECRCSTEHIDKTWPRIDQSITRAADATLAILAQQLRSSSVPTVMLPSSLRLEAMWVNKTRQLQYYDDAIMRRFAENLSRSVKPQQSQTFADHWLAMSVSYIRDNSIALLYALKCRCACKFSVPDNAVWKSHVNYLCFFKRPRSWNETALPCLK